MKIQFTVKYKTSPGQSLWITGSIPELNNGRPKEAIRMEYFDSEHWRIVINLHNIPEKPFTYRYFVKNENLIFLTENDNHKTVSPSLLSAHKVLVVEDTWNDAGLTGNLFYTAPFKTLFPARKSNKKILFDVETTTHLLLARCPTLAPTETLCLLGDFQENEWDTKKPILSQERNDWFVFPLYICNNGRKEIRYKYGIYNVHKKCFVRYENGENRTLHFSSDLNLVHDNLIRIDYETWHGNGVAIPIFSLRSEDGLGIGEFLDIKLYVQWARKVGINLLQLLPINDTTRTKTWRDSYPYAAISAFALHPIYLRLEEMAGDYTSPILKSVLQQKKVLNALDGVDYEKVYDLKMQAMRDIYSACGKGCLATPGFQTFYQDNREWLVPYAAFCYLRDIYETADCSKWKTNAVYDADDIEKLTEEHVLTYNSVAFYYFLQYHLHLQLKEAVDFAHQNQVVIKGDIPIGVSRHACDVWQWPDLFDMSFQVGAPPDDFSAQGQNWGFPIYHWENMRKDDFQWWRRRFAQIEKYFDACRIDHILGFFRIWSIPCHAVEGLLGYFIPAIAIAPNEFNERYIGFDEERFCSPFITNDILSEVFGQERAYVEKKFLCKKSIDQYVFLEAFDTQRKIENHFQTLPYTEKNENLKRKLFHILANVILIPDTKTAGKYHFRINMISTLSYKYLDADTQGKLKDFYYDYFYRRQNQFWYQEGKKKLPMLRDISSILICGEDLGMVPDCVPTLMKELGTLSLEVQRMPKFPGVQFSNPAHAPYLSVVTPSTHDMSTLRAWWEEDPDVTQAFYQHQLFRTGKAPKHCGTEIIKSIVKQHVDSPAMWRIFQLQDLFGISEQLRVKDFSQERINQPANSTHYWRYRMHISLEKLLTEEDFNRTLKSILT